MKITMNLDLILAKRKIRSKQLADATGLTEANISLLKTGRSKGIRFSTLASICHFLRCQPGDIIEYVDEFEEIKG
jgi:putative transcriptional regulator